MSIKTIAIFLTRYALAITFLSAVADRLGLWGASGTSNVVWGDYTNFLNYTALLTPWSSPTLVPIIGGITTGLEIILSLGLIIGFHVRETSLCSALLLLIFAASMTFTIGVKAPLDYNVFTAFTAAFLIYATSGK